MVDVYIARRSFSVSDRRYAIGERVNTEGLTPGKIAQLVEQRWIRHANKPKMIAARPFSFAGHVFQTGDFFPLRSVRAEKVQQLLEHRYIQPQAIPTT